jgi:Raf kinase inhibitor-like YbhB/YbcL family protein
MILAAAAAFALASATFKPNTSLPLSAAYDKCGGGNVSPELHWSHAPRGTRSFAVIAFDPDATGGWYHWVAYNIPASVHELRAGMRLQLSDLGATSFKQLRYGGPCPPPGKAHHYIFTLYALNVSRIGRTGMTGLRAEAAMRKHILARASMTGLYRR